MPNRRATNIPLSQGAAAFDQEMTPVRSIGDISRSKGEAAGTIFQVSQALRS